MLRVEAECALGDAGAIPIEAIVSTNALSAASVVTLPLPIRPTLVAGVLSVRRLDIASQPLIGEPIIFPIACSLAAQERDAIDHTATRTHVAAAMRADACVLDTVEWGCHSC